MQKTNFFRSLVNKAYFDQSQFPLEKRKKFNLKNIFVTFGSLLLISIGFILYFAPDSSQRDIGASATPEYSVNSSMPETNQNVPSHSNNSRFQTNGAGISYGGSLSQSQPSSRTRNANQVIKRGMGGNDPSAQLPLGTTIKAKLTSTVLSTNSASPVMSVTLQDTETNTGTSIPQGSRVVGNATFDEASRRIQIVFHTVIYEDGSQHSIQAMAVMPDGSAGLDGDYHSGEGKRQLGGFLSNFIGGLADGMKERTSGGGVFGGSVEPGSIKNGILNGVSISASDEAKQVTTDLSNEKPSMSIQAGFPFLLFLQKEYVP